MSGIFGKKEEYRQALSGKGIRVVEVSGESCANCVTLMPVLKTITEERGLPLVHVEADYASAELMREWGIEKVPTVLLTEEGEIFARCSGFQPEEILALWLDAKIAERTGKE